MTDADKLKLCVGCRDDFYNDKNPMGVKRCWLLENARKVTRTRIGTWEPPPYRWIPQETLSCHTPDGAHWIDRNDPRIKEAEPCGTHPSTPAGQ